MSIYGDTITLKNVILTLIYNCLGDEVVDKMRDIDDNEWYEYIEEFGYTTATEQGKGGKKGKRKNKTRKRGGMPPKESFGQKIKRHIIGTLNFCGIVCNSLYDALIIISIIVSLYYGVQMFIESYEALTPIRQNLIEPLKNTLTNTTYAELLSDNDKALIALDDISFLQYIGENPNNKRVMRKIMDVGSHVFLIAIGSLVKKFNASPEFLHLSTLSALGMNDGSRKLDQVVVGGMNSIFDSCFSDMTTSDSIDLAKITLRTLRIDQQSRELLNRIIAGKEAEYNANKTPTPKEAQDGRSAAAAAAAEVVVDDIPVTEGDVGFWSRTVNSVSDFVGTAKDKVVSAAIISKEAINEFGSATVSSVHNLGVAIKVATTANDRADCMGREFFEIYDDNKRKYEEYMAGVRKQSNRIDTAISYSRSEARAGWGLIGFSLCMLSYYRRQIRYQNIQARLDAVENGNAQAQILPRGQRFFVPVRDVNGRLVLGLSPGRRRAQEAQLQIENTNQDEKKEDIGGGRTRRRATQTKKRRRRIKRRQTRKLRRNTKRRRM